MPEGWGPVSVSALAGRVEEEGVVWGEGLVRGMEEMARSWERGREVLVVVGGGCVGDWDMRSEEHSREEPGRGFEDGAGGGCCCCGAGEIGGCEAGRSGCF